MIYLKIPFEVVRRIVSHLVGRYRDSKEIFYLGAFTTGALCLIGVIIFGVIADKSCKPGGLPRTFFASIAILFLTPLTFAIVIGACDGSAILWRKLSKFLRKVKDDLITEEMERKEARKRAMKRRREQLEREEHSKTYRNVRWLRSKGRRLQER